MSKERTQYPPLPMAEGHHFGRRKFILQCSAVATVAAVPAGLGLLSAPGRREVALDQLGFFRFTPLVGTHFDVRLDQARVRLELIEASAGRHHSPRQSAAGGVEPEEFSLIFRGVGNPALEQNSYPFAHEEIGRFVMFIVPVGAPGAAGGRHYQAVFNRPAAAASPAQVIYG